MLTTPIAAPATSVARRLAVVLASIGLAVAVPAAAASVDYEALQVREPHRPHSADAAERWWLECMPGMPHSADAAERAAAECW